MYPVGLLRTTASAKGYEGSSAKCRCSARTQPSQNSARPGPSRRLPCSQDASRSPSIHSSPARNGRTAARRPPLDEHHGGRVQRPRRPEAPGRPVVRRVARGRAPRERIQDLRPQPVRPGEELLMGGEVVQAQHGSASEGRGQPHGRRCSCRTPRARRPRPAAPARRTGAGSAAGARDPSGRSCPHPKSPRSVPPGVTGPAQVTPVDQTNIDAAARAESLAGSGFDPR